MPLLSTLHNASRRHWFAANSLKWLITGISLSFAGYVGVQHWAWLAAALSLTFAFYLTRVEDLYNREMWQRKWIKAVSEQIVKYKGNSGDPREKDVRPLLLCLPHMFVYVSKTPKKVTLLIKEDHFGEEFDTQVEIETGKREKSVTEVLCEKIETIETGKRKKSVSEVLLEKEYGIRSTD